MVHLSSAALLLAGTALAMPANKSPRQDAAACDAKAALPTVNSATLPNPFKFWDGSDVLTVEDFKCRQKQLQYALEQTELGDFPPPPDSVTATLTGQGLSIAVNANGNSITFSVRISGAGSGSSPSGAVIAYGASSVPVPAGVATIAFSNDGFAAQSGQASRGQGLFYNLFGRDHSAGALTAWAWGVGRIVDALEQLGPEATGIDPTRLAVTGCSRNGKGAFIAGALEPRIALTIPQESGSGGAACWRIADDEKAKGANIQHAGQIVGENVWFSPRFNSWTSKISQDPVDHEALVALIAPRGLYIPENNIDWLGPVAITGCMQASQAIYKALGVPTHMGFSLTGGHNHCQFPGSQQSQIAQYWSYFIQGGTTAPSAISESTVTVDIAKWAPWGDIPTLTGEW
ncbi:related to 4-O-methyl-glucuronoyl methylesterase [Cephalotrichum gorgonifer]|uniref:(4-O-methyl)-D-glucuronate--lignin esterase n=1 Tax=Cephalotrichum gorgonifer TaxID=2041049 RepID=A0AAE8SUW2_9PEZI|nr:related to 4-O-methyl-glucuronoyl methylesterase [Cephalotrichum gorgonifer]